MSGGVVFLLSVERSGSTLLDQLLGAHPDVASIGEAHWLTAYVRNDRSIYNPAHPMTCACGQKVTECAFWQKVSMALGRPLDSLQTHLRGFHKFGAKARKTGILHKVSRLPTRLILDHPTVFRSSVVQRAFGGSLLAHDSHALFDAIFKASGSRYIVDSSKNPYRFRAIHDQQPARCRAILLARDYRAVVYSKMKRGASMDRAAVLWRDRMRQIEMLTADLPTERKHRLTYEALCSHPERELRRVCEFLDLEFSSSLLQRPTTGVHHIGGSPSKFEASKVSISLDTRYQKVFDPAALQTLQDLVGEVADIWGY